MKMKADPARKGEEIKTIANPDNTYRAGFGGSDQKGHIEPTPTKEQTSDGAVPWAVTIKPVSCPRVPFPYTIRFYLLIGKKN